VVFKEKRLLELTEIKNGTSVPSGGGGGNRTRVQTYSSKAFYMLISLLLVGDEQEMNQPIHHLAECVFCSRHSLQLQHSVFVLSRRQSLVTEQPAPRPE